MGALPVPKLSVEEYLAADRAAELKSEYHDGEMFPMVAVSWEHAIISANLAGAMRDRLSKTPCRAAMAPLRVRVSPTKYIIPDMVVVCGKPALTDEYNDTLTNPKVVVEVLSPSTKDYDYGERFILYRRLASFEEYVLVSQDRARIEVFLKTADKRWILSTYEGLDAICKLNRWRFPCRFRKYMQAWSFLPPLTATDPAPPC